jgi:RNA polymerase sigma-70 factor (ECF subfamily)
LVTVFRNFVSNRHAQQTALKRGGHMRQESGDAALATPAADPDFDRDWAEVVLANARARLASEKDGRQDRLTSFLSCNAEPGDYAQIGADLGLSEGAVKVAVHRLRQRFAELIRIEIAETLAEPTPQAIDDELAALLAVRRASV